MDQRRGRASDSRRAVGRQGILRRYLKGHTQATWNPTQPGSPPQPPKNEPNRPAPPAPGGFEPAGSRPAAPQAQSAAADQATIGKSLGGKGEVTGSESVY